MNYVCHHVEKMFELFHIDAKGAPPYMPLTHLMDLGMLKAKFSILK